MLYWASFMMSRLPEFYDAVPALNMNMTRLTHKKFLKIHTIQFYDKLHQIYCCERFARELNVSYRISDFI